MKQLRTKAIVLKRIDYGEADRIMTLLTSDYGKIRVMARGARKQKSKLAGGIELFSVSDMHFIKGRGEIDTLVSTRLDVHYGAIVRDLSRTELAYTILKSVHKTVEDNAGSDYFDLVQESFVVLNNVDFPLEIAEASFTMRMIELLGHMPELRTNESGQPLDQDKLFEFDFDKISFFLQEDGRYDKNHLKVLKLLAHNPPDRLRQVQGMGRYVHELLPLIRTIRGQFIPGN